MNGRQRGQEGMALVKSHTAGWWKDDYYQLVDNIKPGKVFIGEAIRKLVEKYVGPPEPQDPEKPLSFAAREKIWGAMVNGASQKKLIEEFPGLGTPQDELSNGSQTKLWRRTDIRLSDKMSNFTWSYSRLKNFETCPKRHYHYDIAKDVTDEETYQQSEGHETHKAFELRIRNGRKLPMPLAYHEPIMAKLEALPGENFAEQKLALTEEFKPTGFFSDKVWFRTVLDFCNVNGETAAVLDYKTGKPNSDMTQLQLMGVTVMHYQPTVSRVRARLLFVNHNKAERAEFNRDDVPKIWAEILPRVRRLREAVEQQEFPPKPSGLCVRYCAVVSCPFHGRGTHAP